MRAYPRGDIRNRDPATVARNRVQFLMMVSLHLGLNPLRSTLPRNIVLEFFRDEKIEFGDPRYVWNYAAAGELVAEYMREG